MSIPSIRRTLARLARRVVHRHRVAGVSGQWAVCRCGERMHVDRAAWADQLRRG